MSLQRPLGLGARDLVPLVVALGVLGIGEGIARAKLQEVGDDWMYWSAIAAAKVDEAEAFLVAREGPAVLVVGDSTAARHLDPTSLEAGGGRAGAGFAYNLGFPGNFPLAFDAAMTGFVLPRLSLEPGDYLLVSFHPKGFEKLERVAKSEAGILDSAAGHQGRGKPVVARLLRLAALRAAAKIERSRGRQPPPAAEARGWLPLAKVRPRAEWAEDDPEPELVAERLEALDHLLAFARARQLKAIVIVPPHPADRRARSEPIVQDLRARCAKAGVPLMDYRQHDRFETLFGDPVHLSPEGARLFSRMVGADLATLQ